MIESAKTLLFLACAVAVGALVWVARPADPGRGVVDDAGELFFADFTDPLTAASLEIIGFNETLATVHVFKVARHNGVWSIPSHENYPADAENQFGNAAASMIGLVKGAGRSDQRTDHALYKVVDPTEADAGSTGVGTRVTLAGEDGRVITDLIIGTAVKDSNELRYVRVPGVDRVYMCEIDIRKFSTRFEDWIEKDLLQLTPADITGVVVKDYSIDEFSRQVIQGGVVTLTYDGQAFSWGLEGLGEDESLVQSKLIDLRRGLDELKIIDVHRKPAGLSSELRAEDALQLDTEAVRSLQSRGFFIAGGRLLSNQGETVVQMSGGVQYVLRFGEIAAVRGGGDDDDDSAGVPGRYLFVTVEFNAQAIPGPELMELPDLDSFGLEDESESETDDPAATQPSMSEAIEKAREMITRDNQRKQQDYDQKLQDGRARVSELTDRFADWYYVISDSVYNNVRLTRADIVEQTPAAQGE